LISGGEKERPRHNFFRGRASGGQNPKMQERKRKIQKVLIKVHWLGPRIQEGLIGTGPEKVGIN